MHYTGKTFRPPLESHLDTKLLQVTVGCAHNRCTFCTMYRDVKFSLEPLSQIEEDVKELRAKFSKIDRIFLVNGDAFVLSKDRLKEISDLIIKHIPEISVITMYSSINNIKSKSDEDLLAIKEMRIDELWIGIETGHQDTLININKGHNLDEAINQLNRLTKAGIKFNGNFILGVAGGGRGEENAIATAELINKTKPQLVWFGTLGLVEGCELHSQMLAGKFKLATELEILNEEIKLLELIKVDNIRFYGTHPSNTTSVSGVLPQDREDMISEIISDIQHYGKEFLSTSLLRKSL